MSGAKDRARQARGNVNKRKAKSRAKAASEFRSWIDRDRKKHSRPDPVRINPFAAAARQMDLMARLSRLSPADEADQREAVERFLCRVFGEEYRP